MNPGTINVLQVGLGFFLLFVQFNSRGYIQEAVFASVAEQRDINPHAGYYGLSAYYFVFTFANLFISPLLDRLGPRWGMAIGALLTTFYEAGFLHINEVYFYVTSVAAGFGAALIWPAMGTYLTQNSTEKTTERNSSIVWAMSQTSQIVGGFILFAVFHHAKGEDYITETAQLVTCIAFTIFLILSVIVFATLRAPHGPCRDVQLPTGSFADEMGATFKLMLTKRMFYLGVVFSYTGIVQSFWTSVYPTCISFTMNLNADNMTVVAASSICSGLGQVMLCIFIALPSFPLNRRSIVILGCILHLLVFIGVYLLFPVDASLQKSYEPTVFPPNVFLTLLLSFILGFGDGCWNTQVYALIVDVFPHCSNPAFALFNFYQSAFTSLALFYSSFFLLPHHLAILGATAIIGAICFYAVEKMGRIEYEPPIEKIMAAESLPPSEA